jgi:hypothetical protein
MPTAGDAAAEIERITQEENYYAILGVEKTASVADLKKAYRRLCLKLHPDKCSLEGAQATFQKIGGAYSCLSGEDSRAHYDRFGSDSTAGGGAPPQRDPEEVFREFMAENPDLAKFMQAGLKPGQTMPNFDPSNPTAMLHGFNFSAAAVATAWDKWEEHRAGLPAVLRPPAYAFGLTIYLLVQAFLKTMPLSAVVLFALGVWAFWRIAGWFVGRLLWLMVIWQAPMRYRPRFLIQVGLLLVSEYALGFVFDWQRGFAAFCCAWLLSQAWQSTQTKEQRQQQQQQQQQSPFVFHYSTGGGSGGDPFGGDGGFGQQRRI